LAQSLSGDMCTCQHKNVLDEGKIALISGVILYVIACAENVF